MKALETAIRINSCIKTWTSKLCRCHYSKRPLQNSQLFRWRGKYFTSIFSHMLPVSLSQFFIFYCPVNLEQKCMHLVDQLSYYSDFIFISSCKTTKAGSVMHCMSAPKKRALQRKHPQQASFAESTTANNANRVRVLCRSQISSNARDTTDCITDCCWSLLYSCNPHLNEARY